MNPDLECPTGKIEKDEAYNDYISTNSIGLMNCYCDGFGNDWKKLATETFPDGKAHCRGTGFNKGMKLAATSLDASSVVILNGLVSTIFKFLGDF